MISITMQHAETQMSEQEMPVKLSLLHYSSHHLQYTASAKRWCSATPVWLLITYETHAKHYRKRHYALKKREGKKVKFYLFIKKKNEG